MIDLIRDSLSAAVTAGNKPRDSLGRVIARRTTRPREPPITAVSPVAQVPRIAARSAARRACKNAGLPALSTILPRVVSTRVPLRHIPRSACRNVRQRAIPGPRAAPTGTPARTTRHTAPAIRLTGPRPTARSRLSCVRYSFGHCNRDEYVHQSLGFALFVTFLTLCRVAARILKRWTSRRGSTTAIHRLGRFSQIAHVLNLRKSVQSADKNSLLLHSIAPGAARREHRARNR